MLYFDLPRGMKRNKLADLYYGIEAIKNGVAYDKRNHVLRKCDLLVLVYMYLQTHYLMLN